MKIKKVELHNIRSHKNSAIEFPSSSILLSGDIGSGKSSVLLALEFALFGLKKGELEGNALLRHGCSNGYVKVNFEIEGKDFTIYREINKKKNSYQQGKCFIEINGKKELLSVEEINTKITNLLNFTDAKKKNLIYRFTVYTPQEEMKRILIEKPDVRLEIIRKLFDIDKYKRIKDNLAIYLRNLRNEIKAYNEEIKDIDSLRNKVEELGKELIDIENEKKKISKEIERVINEESKLNERLKIINKKKEEIEKNIVIYKELRAKKEEKNRTIKNLEEEIRDFKEPNIEKVKKEKIELIEKSNAIDKFIEINLEKIKQLRENKENLAKHIFFHKKKIKENIEAIEESKKLDICPKCKQKVSEEHKRNIIQKINKEIEESRNFVRGNENKLKELESEIEKIEKEIEEKNKEARIIEKEIRDKDYIIDKIRDYEKKREWINRLRKEIKEIEEEISKVKFDEREYEKLKEEEERLNIALERVEENLKFLKEELARFEERLKFTKKELEEKKEELNKKERTLKKIEKIKKFENWLSNEFYSVIEKLEKIVLIKINKDFEALLKRWFSMLIEDTIEIRLAEDFTPIIEQNGYETDYLNLSGGEKTALALAYRLALNQLINSFTNVKTKGLIILDEPTDGFSQNQLEKMRDIFKEINAKQLIIVSHDPKIESFVDYIIRFEKKEGITKVEI